MQGNPPSTNVLGTRLQRPVEVFQCFWRATYPLHWERMVVPVEPGSDSFPIFWNTKWQTSLPREQCFSFQQFLFFSFTEKFGFKKNCFPSVNLTFVWEKVAKFDLFFLKPCKRVVKLGPTIRPMLWFRWLSWGASYSLPTSWSLDYDYCSWLVLGGHFLLRCSGCDPAKIFLTSKFQLFTFLPSP